MELMPRSGRWTMQPMPQLSPPREVARVVALALLLFSSTAAAEPDWLDRAVRDARRSLSATVCLGGLEASGCRHRLLGLLERVADFDALAAAVLSGLDAPEAPAERARFRDALRAALVRSWERRLTGSAAVTLRVVDASGDRATLRLERGRDAVDVALWLGDTAAGPRIVNVGIDGADIVHTWRPRVARMLRDESWAALIAALEHP